MFLAKHSKNIKVGYFNYLTSHIQKFWNVKILGILGFLSYPHISTLLGHFQNSSEGFILNIKVSKG